MAFNDVEVVKFLRFEHPESEIFVYFFEQHASKSKYVPSNTLESILVIDEGREIVFKLPQPK